MHSLFEIFFRILPMAARFERLISIEKHIKFSRHYESGLLEQNIEERSAVNWSGVESSVLERIAVFLSQEE